MKRIFTFIVVILLTASVFAQTPQKMSYQAVIRNSSNNLVASKLIGMQISILQGSSNGTVVYKENQTPTTNANGLVSLEIGAGTVVSGNFSTIDWASDIYFIKTETDPNGGINYTITGVSQLLSVPYALHAKTAEIYTGTITETDPFFSAWNKNYNDLTNKPNLFDGNYSSLSNLPALFSGSYSDLTNKPLLFSGSFNDLTNKPTTIAGYGITDAFNGNYNNLTNKPTLFSGSYSDLTNKPNLFSGSFNDLTNKPTTIAGYGITDAFDGNYNNLTNKPALFSGSYTDLTNKPSLFSGHFADLKTKPTTLSGYGITDAFDGNYNNLTNKPTLFSGSYTDLTNKPIIDGSETKVTAGTNITITGNGTTASPYVVNQSSGTVAGQMLYWNGTAWVTVAAGLNGQILKYKNGVPTWTDGNINDLSIGDAYQGGIIAYFLVPGDPGYDVNVKHGIIAAPSDQSTGSGWGCQGTGISGADGTALGTGNQNTLDIAAGCSQTDIAAKICNNLVLNGYTDWYLPSKDELNKLYLNREAIGGFANAIYWSSSENLISSSWRQHFGTGYVDAYFKLYNHRVRAIRAF